jgi:D-alanyl-D-alanine carboxypeptidase
VLVAERLGGTEARFSANMTARARELGMTETRFANASGLPDARHRTTARDMATLAQALWRDFPQYYQYFQTPSFSWRRTSGRNHNRLLGPLMALTASRPATPAPPASTSRRWPSVVAAA